MQAQAEQLFFQGNRYLAAHDAANAKACYSRAVSLAPRLGEAHANLGWLHAEAGEYEQADECYRRAVAARPSYTEIYLNYGAFLAQLKRFHEAERVYMQAIEFDAHCAPAWSNLGALYAQISRHDEAEACCRRSLLLDPNYDKARINLSYLCLRQGRFEEGLALYESRSWRCALETRVDCARWAGEMLAGKSLLIGHEGGYGDIIQFCRYASVLKRKGARRITLLCYPALQTLMASLGGVDEILCCDDPLPRSGWDYWTSLMSIPYHCGTRLDSIPASLPYLHAHPRTLARWHSALPDTTGALVGLVWRGSASFQNDAERSIPSLDLLEPLGGVRGVRFVSLQKGPGEDEAARACRPLNLVHLGSQLENFADTAAIVQNLDLVISVDTAVAHLAGALGKPCWVLLPHTMTDWRWFVERSDSPWYPGGLRLYRQPARGDWASVIAQVRVALRQFLREGSAPRVPAPDSASTAAGHDRRKLEAP